MPVEQKVYEKTMVSIIKLIADAGFSVEEAQSLLISADRKVNSSSKVLEISEEEADL